MKVKNIRKYLTEEQITERVKAMGEQISKASVTIIPTIQSCSPLFFVLKFHTSNVWQISVLLVKV